MNPLLAALQHNRQNRPQHTYKFQLEIESAPEDLKFFVREVTMSLGSLEIEEIQSGALRFGLPRAATVSRLELTLQIDEAGRVVDYFKEWRYTVLKRDGTFGVPFGSSGYVRQASILSLDDKYNPSYLFRRLQVFPETLGQLNFTTKQAEAMEAQVTLVQFMPTLTQE